jgi:hypothetical protein
MDAVPEYLEVPESLIKSAWATNTGRAFTCGLQRSGYWRLATKDSVIYSIMILNCGSWGFLGIYDGTRRLIWAQPSTFTGSFVLEGFCKDGIIVDNGFGRRLGTNITVNWKE